MLQRRGGNAALLQTQTGTPFVGRAAELRELEAALDEARAGHGRAVLLGGEPGVGKSRLADELATRAATTGTTVLWGRGWEDAGAPPYWPWVQALRTLLRSTRPEALRRHLGAGAADVAQMLPELRSTFADLPLPTDTDSESARFQLFDSAATFLRNAAQDRPIVVVLDDLQAADTPSILLLRFVASQVSDMAVLVLGTYRDIELTPEHPLTSAISEMARERVTRLIALKGLASADVGQYIAAAIHGAPKEQLVAAVWRETNGNALFVGEAVRLLAAEGRLDEVGDLASLRIAVPAGIRAVIARRVSLLSADAGTALEMASVLGPEFSIDVVRRVAELPADKALDAADEAVAGRLLVPVAGAAGRYRFAHDLVRETLYDGLPTAKRIRLHLRVADTLEQLYGSAADAHLAELAFHYFEAAQGGAADDATEAAAGLFEKATAYARRAGDEAARSLAYEEAARLYRMALPPVDGSVAADLTARAELLLALGDVEARAGALDEARVDFLEAAELARRVPSATLLARAALGFGGRHYWARAGNDTKLVPLLQDALVLLGSEDDRLRVRLLTRLACAWRSSPERRNDSDALSKTAVEIARRLNDPATLSYSLTGRFWGTWWPENPEERERISGEIVAIAEQVGDGERIAEAHLMRFLSLTELGRMDEAHRAAEKLSRVVEELRQPAQMWLEPVNRAELALIDGDYPLAEGLIERELASTYRVTPVRDDISAARMHMFLLRREQGRVAEIEGIVRESVNDFPWYPMHKAAMAIVLLELDRHDEARPILAELVADDAKQIYRDNEWLLGISLTAEAAALLSDGAAARVLYNQMVPFAGRHAIGHAEGSVGVVDRYLGLLAATLGQFDDAERHLTNAVDQLGAMGARPWRAHAQHDLAEVLDQRAKPGDSARAQELDREALDVATALGMALATRIHASPQPTTRGGNAGPVSTGRLEREGEFWRVQFGAESFQLRDSKGLHHLARLLATPGQELHSLDLAAAEAPVPAQTGKRADRDDSLTSDASGDTGPVLDAEAKAAYRERLEDLREELEEARSWNDPERVARLEAEAAALAHELTGAFGLGGRERSTGSSAERARVSVTRAIRTALDRIAEYSPALGSHLAATIRTGTFCSYTPDPRAPIEWQVT